MMINRKHKVSAPPFSTRALVYTIFLGCSTMGIASVSALDVGISYATPASNFTNTIIIPPVKAEHPKPVTTSSSHSTLSSGLLNVLRNVVSNVATTASAVLRPIGSTIYKIGSTVTKIGSTIGSTISNIGSHIGHFFGPVATRIGSGIGNVIHGGAFAIGTGISTVGTALSTVANFIGLVLTSTSNPPAVIAPSAAVLAQSAGKIPTVLIHGAFSNSTSMIHYYNALEQAGIPAYSLTIGGTHSVLGHLFSGINASASIDADAQELSDYIKTIQAETKSPKVNLIGYSEGGLITRDYITKYAQNNVQASVSLGGAAHGTNLDGLTYILHALPKGLQNIVSHVVSVVVGQGANDTLTGSPFLQSLNKYPETKAGIHYLNIATKDDLMATPYQTSWLKPVPGADVSNIEVHSIPGVAEDFDHLLYPSDPALIKAVVQYIDDKGEPAKIEHSRAKTHTNSSPGVQIL